MEYTPFLLCSLVAAVLLDLALGDPPNHLHPVVCMGRVIRALAPSKATWVANEASAPVGEPDVLARWDWATFLHGAGITLAGAALFALPLWLAQAWLLAHSLPLALLLSAFGLKAAIAYRGLERAAQQVGAALAGGDLPKARHLLSWHLVSRDTRQLDVDGVVAATIESVAENMTDAVTAPLFYFVLGGLPAAWAYRYVNTCDSLLGYRDPLREYLGKFPARLDDLLNWLPARLTGLALVLAAALAGADARQAARTMWSQHSRTSSPNAGWTMSAMAGALGVTLEKAGHYSLEGGSDPLDPSAIARALAVARTTLGVTWAALAAAVCLRLLFQV